MAVMRLPIDFGQGAKCAYCVFSIGTNQKDMLCTERNELVQPDICCEKFMREPGADDE